MKKAIVALLCIPVWLCGQGPSKKISALFLGNSYTYYNNLPLLIYNIALANGDTLDYDSNLIGGYTFNNHVNDAVSLSKINAKNWDVVVLQAQSQEPSFSPAQVNAQTLPYALRLDSVIKQNHACSHTVFYETWGRKFGDASNCQAYPPVCTYTGMQNRLKQSYQQFAQACQGLVSPVGEAFRASITASPSLELYDPDQSHPSLNGSYLAAAVFYEVLFQKSVISNTYNPGLNAAVAGFLQQTAHATVRDSLVAWFLGSNFPWADFGITPQSAFNFQFQGYAPALSNTWYFGDGAQSTAASPAHVYATTGTYNVSHVVSDGCKKDSVVKALSIIASGIPQFSAPAAQLRAWPSPCSDRLSLSADFDTADAMLELSDATGRLLYRGAFTPELTTAGLSNGLYLLQVSHGADRASLRFIRQE